MGHLAILALGALHCWIGEAALAASPICDEAFLTRPVKESSSDRFDAATLATLIDIGQGENGSWQPSPLALSPEGDRIAFQLRRAMPEANAYCLGIFMLDLRHNRMVALDIGGDLITDSMSLRGLAAVPVGMPAIIAPAWSVDGQWVAYRRRSEGITQIWRARADGSGAEKVTTALDDVEALQWSVDGVRLFFATRPGLREMREAIDREGLAGFHYDQRFSPMLASRPQPTEPVMVQWWSLAPSNRTVAPLSQPPDPRDASAAIPAFLTSRPLISRLGYAASIEKLGNDLMARSSLILRARDGARIPCAEPSCQDALDLWWGGDGATLWYLKREGWARNAMALYSWRMGTPRPVLVYSTQGVLTGCQLARVALLCLFETATTPGRIVRFDLRRRTMKTLFDPNPHLSVVRIGHTQRLFAKTTFDIEAFGDLVLPPDHRPGQRHPLIIVQYSSRGFLRGGTGDEFPIQPLAAAGMAVLSFQRPRDYVVEGARQLDDLTHAEQKDWGDRRNVQSALDQLIDQAVATGTIDESRMGLTGLSDGASTAQFALLNGRMQYKAVSLASCCEDEATFTALGGPALADGRKVSGYPAWGDVVDPWRIYSLSRNAARLTTPMLLQLADSEYLLSLESVRALNAERAMVDLFVFPDERHIKWQPAHRLAIYRRNIDWFAFWLQDARPSFAEGASHFARWDAMRQGLPSRPGCVEGAC